MKTQLSVLNRSLGASLSGAGMVVAKSIPVPASSVSVSVPATTHEALSDRELFHLCQQYGKNARLWTRKFAGLLLEVNRRKLYLRKGFASIYEFASKLSGMAHANVDRILRLAEKLRDKPELRKLLENGTVGWSKIETVAYIATSTIDFGADKFWAKKVTLLSQGALEEYVKEHRKANRSNNRLEVTVDGNLENNTIFQQGVLGRVQAGFEAVDSKDKAAARLQARFRTDLRNTRGLTVGEAGDQAEIEAGIFPEKDGRFKNFSFPIDPEIEFKLKLLKQALEKEKGETLTFNKVLGELLKAYEENQKLQKIVQGKKIVRKVVSTELCPKCLKTEMDEREERGETKRAIPAAVKKFVDARSGGKCEYPHCNEPGEIYHHTRRFWLSENHDPEFIFFLCKSHERLAHNGLIENEEKYPSHWKLREEPDKNSSKYYVDSMVGLYR